MGIPADPSRVNTSHAKLSQSVTQAVTGVGASNSVCTRRALTAAAIATRKPGSFAPRAEKCRRADRHPGWRLGRSSQHKPVAARRSGAHDSAGSPATPLPRPDSRACRHGPRPNNSQSSVSTCRPAPARDGPVRLKPRPGGGPSDIYATSRRPGSPARARDAPSETQVSTPRRYQRCSRHCQSSGPAGASPGRPTQTTRRVTDAAAPTCSNDSERLPRPAGFRSSAEMPPACRRRSDRRYGALSATTRAATRPHTFPTIEGALSGPAGGRRGCYGSSPIEGEENGVPGVIFRHTRSNEQSYGPLDMTKREQMICYLFRMNLFSFFDLCVSCLLPELDHQFGA